MNGEATPNPVLSHIPAGTLGDDQANGAVPPPFANNPREHGTPIVQSSNALLYGVTCARTGGTPTVVIDAETVREMCAGSVLSVTVSENPKRPTEPVVPEIVPAGSIVSPNGRNEAVQLYGGVPPLAVSVVAYGIF